MSRSSKALNQNKNSDCLDITIILPASILKSNESYHISLKVLETSKLEDIVKVINHSADLSDHNLSFFLSKDDNKRILLDIHKTVLDNGIENGSIIKCRSSRKALRLSNANEDDSDDSMSESDYNIIELSVTTRISSETGAKVAYPPIRVRVNAGDTLAHMMEDISVLYEGKTGLKFKYGRSVLSPDKTYSDYYIENGSEIVVTGGRK